MSRNRIYVQPPPAQQGILPGAIGAPYVSELVTWTSGNAPLVFRALWKVDEWRVDNTSTDSAQPTRVQLEPIAADGDRLVIRDVAGNAGDGSHTISIFGTTDGLIASPSQSSPVISINLNVNYGVAQLTWNGNLRLWMSSF